MATSKYDPSINELRQLLAEERQFHQTRIDQIKKIEVKLYALIGHSNLNLQPSYQAAMSKLAIANSHQFSEEELENINKDDFDIILDMRNTRLGYRQDPAKHTKLKEAKLHGVGIRRIEILSYLLEHPSKDISIESASLLPNQLDIIEPNALAKTISVLRKALEQKGPKGPYIVTKAVWGRKHPYTYQMNQKWKYLVIR